MKKAIIEENELKLFDGGEITPLAIFLAEKYPDKIHEITFVTESGKRMGPYKVKLKNK